MKPVDRSSGKNAEDPYLRLKINPQPDETTCGPTCLQAIYQYFGQVIPLPKLINETQSFRDGGTLDVFLAIHALQLGYRASIYTYNLQVFDPSWFSLSSDKLIDRLYQQLRHKTGRPKLAAATTGYIRFLELGGQLHFEDLSPVLLRRFLKKGIPILTGLSATYLYRSKREWGLECAYDDIRGEPTGHFVVLAGYDTNTRKVLVADPLSGNPISDKQYYEVSIERVIGAILLGIVTYDANLLILRPRTATDNNK